MITAKTIDWIRYTAGSNYSISEMIPQQLDIDYTNRIEPLPYYTHAIGITEGGRIDWNVANPAQGQVVTFSGEDLRAIECGTMAKSAIIEEMREREYIKFTRIDLAIDIVGEECSPTDLYTAFENKEVKTRCKSAKQIHGVCRDTGRDGNTAYFGSRQGETYLRVYDKGSQLARKSGLARGKQKNNTEEKELLKTLQSLLYTRIEAETKGDRANLVAAMIAGQGVEKTCKCAIERFITFPKVSWWCEMLNSIDTPDSDQLRGVNHNTAKSNHWLYTQALSAVIRAIKSEDRNVINPVTLALAELYGGGFFTAE